MGAMHNDLNRCNFMYDQSRRCRNPLQTPGDPFCYYHARRKEKQKEREDPPGEGLASQALFAWLASHPLDSATQINHAVNQLFLCVAGDLISARRADSLVRMARLLLRMVPELRREHNAIFRDTHMQTKERFHKEIGLLLAVAAAQDASAGDSNGAADTPEPEDPPPAKAAAIAAHA